MNPAIADMPDPKSLGMGGSEEFIQSQLQQAAADFSTFSDGVIDHVNGELNHADFVGSEARQKIASKINRDLKSAGREAASAWQGASEAIAAELSDQGETGAKILQPVIDLGEVFQTGIIPTNPPPINPPPTIPPPGGNGSDTSGQPQPTDCNIHDAVGTMSSLGVPEVPYIGPGGYYGVLLTSHNGCCEATGISKQVTVPADLIFTGPHAEGYDYYPYWICGSPQTGVDCGALLNYWLAVINKTFPIGACGGRGSDTVPGGGGSDTVPPSPQPCCPPDPVNPDTDKNGGEEKCCFPCPTISEKDIRNVRILPWGKKQGKESWLDSLCGKNEVMEFLADKETVGDILGKYDEVIDKLSNFSIDELDTGKGGGGIGIGPR